MLIPRKVSDSARPRKAGATRLTARAEAAAVNMAPAPISTRPTNRTDRSGASAQTRQPALNSASANWMARLRDHLEVRTMSKGASTAVALA